jgi:serine/threonine protein kinase
MNERGLSEGAKFMKGGKGGEISERGRFDIIIGTPLYMAPEVCGNERDDRSVAYDFRVGVYSYGMLLYMMFAGDQIPTFTTGVSPTSPHQLFGILGSGIRYEKPAQVTPFYWDLIQRCWAQDWNSRPTFAEIIGLLLETQEYAFPGTDMRTLVEYEERITTFQSET